MEPLTQHADARNLLLEAKAGRRPAMTEAKLRLLEAVYVIGLKASPTDLCSDASAADDTGT